MNSSKSWNDIVSIGVLLCVSAWVASYGWDHSIGGGELLNIQAGIIASTPQDPSNNAFLGYLTHLHLFRHAIFTPRPLYQTIFVDLFGTSAVPFHVVALVYSFGTAVFLYLLGREIRIRWVISFWMGVSLLVSSALAMRWYGIEAGTTHNAVALFMMCGLFFYERYRSRGRWWGVAAITSFAMAGISYPSGFVVLLLPVLRELAGTFLGRFGDRSSRGGPSRLQLPIVSLLIAVAILLFNSQTTQTFSQAGEGGAIIGTRYGEGVLTGLAAWAGSFWTPLPSSLLAGANDLYGTALNSQMAPYLVIITMSLLVLALLIALGIWLAKGSLDFRERAWTIVIAILFGFVVWMLLASTYLYALTSESTSDAGYLLGAFLLSWGTPLEITGNPYYLLTAPIVLLAIGVVADGVLLRIASADTVRGVSFRVLLLGLLGLLVFSNLQTTVGILKQPVVAARSGSPFVDSIKRAYEEFPRGSTIVFFDRFGVSSDLWLWLAYADARRSDRAAEFRALNLSQVLDDNVSWYSERFVGRQMSNEILELYTNISDIHSIFIGPGPAEVDANLLPIDSLFAPDAIVARHELDHLFAFVIEDFNTVTDVTDQIRHRIRLGVLP